jgi:hypothetical protein
MQAQNAEIFPSSELAIFSSALGIWKSVTSVLQTLSEDSTFDVDADGLRTRAMDT